jgi:hypothetical protein
MAIRKIHRVSTNAVIEYYGNLWKLSTSERKTMIHTALRYGGLLWMVSYIPRRFTNYAYGLGYRVTDGWKKFKRRILGGGNSLPFIGVTPPGGGTSVVKKGKQIFKGKRRNAEKMAVAVQRGSNVQVKGTSQGGDIHVAMPLGHPLNKQTADAYGKLPPAETQAVVDEVAKQLASLIQTARPVAGSRAGKLTIRGANSSIKKRG